MVGAGEELNGVGDGVCSVWGVSWARGRAWPVPSGLP